MIERAGSPYSDWEKTPPAILKIARERLYPSLRDPNYLVLRSRRLIFSTWLSQIRGEKLKVLDIGARYQPYRPLFSNRIGRYVTIDFDETSLVDVVADGHALPFAPETFDLVVATQVMEYLRDPGRAAWEIHAVLKPGGVLLASTPACAPRFGEEERWRFTRGGLQTVLSPFAKIEIVPELYSLGSVFRTANLALDMFVRYDFARSIYRRTAGPLLNLLGLGFERMNLTANDQFTANYSVLAIKEH
jgi:SAM-dependent methyltransferase